MIGRRHLRTLDVISVLLFSMFASFLVNAEAVPGHLYSLSLWIKQLSLLVSSVIFYFTVDRLKGFDAEATREYEADRDVLGRAENSIEQRYFAFYRGEVAGINLRLLASLVFFLAFFVDLEAVGKFFESLG